MPESPPGEPKIPSREALKIIGFQLLFTVPAALAVSFQQLLSSQGIDVMITPEKIFFGTYLAETGFYHVAKWVGDKNINEE